MSSSLIYPELEPRFVRLILLPQSNLYLDVPLGRIHSLCLKPRKYLVFLGWCILGIEGGLAERHDGPELDLNGDLRGGKVFYYVKNGDIITDTTHAIELQVITRDSSLSSWSSTDSRSSFLDSLRERDGRCVFTGWPHGIGMHIIPFRRGPEWLQSIVANRPHNDDSEPGIPNDITISDVENGMLGFSPIHDEFDRGRLAILKTPNHILEQSDIPPAVPRAAGLEEGFYYPADQRFTLQWLDEPDVVEVTFIPYNLDAAFQSSSVEPKPSALLLHYMYGEAAIKQWGHGVEILRKPRNSHGPATPASAYMSPPKKRNDHLGLISKLNKADGDGEGSMGANVGGGHLEAVDSEGGCDAADIMYSLMMNSPYAKERRRKEDKAKNERLESWRRQLPSAPN